MIEALKYFVLNLDTNLGVIVSQMGIWSYFVLFLLVFFETGIIFLIFLPGDALLIAAGLIAAKPEFSIGIFWTTIVLLTAGVVGNFVNYLIGYKYGRRMIQSGKMPFIKPKVIQKVERFYSHYGVTAVIFTRIIPYVRNFVPFVAGIAHMNWKKYLFYNSLGIIPWFLMMIFIGYFIGDFEYVKEHWLLVVILIITLPSILLTLRKTMKNRLDQV